MDKEEKDYIVQTQMNPEKHCKYCKYAGWDPDGNYCAHPKVMKGHPYGLAIPNEVLHAEYCSMDKRELFTPKDGPVPEASSPTSGNGGKHE